MAEQYSTVSIEFHKYEYEYKYEYAQLRYYGLPPAALLTSPPNCPSSANPSIPNSFPTFSLHLPLPSQPRLVFPIRQPQHASPLRHTQRLPHLHQRPRLQGGLCRREGTTTAAAVYAICLLSAARAAAAPTMGLRDLGYYPLHLTAIFQKCNLKFTAGALGSRSAFKVRGPAVTSSLRHPP
jgi:hypothetical protein